MVKLDYDRDYYADLELSSTADPVEVKKQFKKLALKFHPDRNPGKEDEAKEKFLVIQAAHEILTDPALKSKFDANRERTARYTGASGVRGNPWQYTSQDVNSKFGAPPEAASDANTASCPYGNINETLGLDAKSEDKDGKRQGTYGGMGPSTAAEQVSPTECGSGCCFCAFFKYFKGEGTSADPADGSRCEETGGSIRDKEDRSAAQASKPKPTSEYVDPLSAQFGETFLDNRQRTPYAANVGERTNPFEPLNFSRAKSMRDGMRKNPEETGDAPPPPPSRQRSASVGTDSFKKSTNEKPISNGSTANPAPQFQSRASARYSPRGPEMNSAPPTSTFQGASGSTSSVNSGANARFSRNSADNINTRFVAEEKGGADFQFSAGTAGAADDGFLRAKQRARGHQSPLRNEFTGSTESVNDEQQQQVPSKMKSDFVPEQWKEAFGPHIFEPPQPNKPAGSPTRPIRPIKKPRPVRMTAGTAGLVDEDDTSGEDKGKPATAAASGINGSRSPNAMDIDTPPPEPSTAQPTGVRNIHVEPSKPEWRAGNTIPNGGAPGGPTEPKLGAGLKVPPPLNPTSAGSEDSDDLTRPVFPEFRNCRAAYTWLQSGRLGTYIEHMKLFLYVTMPLDGSELCLLGLHV
ncbi:hypothetical protein N0V88_004987 [Collariella sp. IMI 366227]|nr:hypothetical protein N0V88_004987 [Collariella sp. IMI 366227]